MRIKALLFAAVFLAVSTNVFAFEHLVNENVSTTFTLRDGDNVVFLDNNSAWNIANRLVFGVSLVSGQELSGSLLVNGCAYKLDGYYKEVDFAYVRGVVVKYQGPEQIVRIQGWVDSSPVIARCEDVGSASVVVKDDDKKSQEELDWLAKKAAQQFQYAVRTAKYRDLGPLETVTLFKGPSGNFKITKLPEWDFNRVYIQVEPMDGRKLNGHLYSNELDQKLSGWSISIPVNRKTDLPFDFELAFPEYRKVKLKWWATMEAAKEEPIQMSEKSLGGDSVEASYTFNKEIYGTHSVKLKFRKSDFVDGKIPVVKKYDVIPDGVLKIDSLKSYGAIGSVYDVHAEFKDDDTITFALPLDYGYIPNDYVAVVLHQVDDKWTPVLADSVVDGFVYFRTNSFSNFTTYSLGLGDVVDFIKDIVVTDACNMALGSYYFEVCQDAARRTAEKTFDGIVNAPGEIKKFYEKMHEYGVDVRCFDFAKLFGDEEKDSWSGVGSGFVSFSDLIPEPDENTFLFPEDKSLWPQGTASVFNDLKNLRNARLTKLSEGKQMGVCNDGNSVEVCDWKVTSRNMEIILADAILARSGLLRRFLYVYYDESREKEFFRSFETELEYKDYFRISSEFIDRANWLVVGLQNCSGALNLEGLHLQKWFNFGKTFSDGKSYQSKCESLFDALDFYGTMSEWLSDGGGCSEYVGENIWREYTAKDMLDEKDDILAAISDVMVRVSLLAWLDGEIYRDFLRLNYQKTYEGVQDWLTLLSPMVMNNNVVAKLHAGMALFEYIFTGKTSNFDALNKSLRKHYGPNGGFSEGMGYSQFVWDDVPYVLSALMDASSRKGLNLKIEENFLKSPDYIFDFSRPIAKPVDESGRVPGLVPVEIDDGCTYNPDYRVWAKLKNDPKYLAMSEYAPLRDDPKKNVLTVFGFPESNLYNSTKKKLPDRGSLWGVNKDGLLMITALQKDENGNVLDTVALSMIAESGDLWTNGQAHDQQDNLSITLTSRNEGFIIQDRGYSGFGERKRDDTFHKYDAHNVVVPDGYSQVDNRQLSSDDLWERLYNFTNTIPGVLLTLVTKLLEGHVVWAAGGEGQRYYFSVYGGEEAAVDADDKNIYDVDNGIIGYTAELSFGTEESLEARNRRTILYFGGSFWVIDRPVEIDDANLKNYYPQSTWLANSPIETWRDLTEAKLKLYGSGLDPLGEDEEDAVEGVETPVVQNGSRADYMYNEKLKKIALSNYSYSFKDESAKTYVMTYAVNDEGFIKTDERCSKDFQCFENAAKDKRLIVAPYGKPFGHCNFLPKDECSYDQDLSFDGIMLAVKEGDGWYVLPLGGQITERNDDDLGEGVIDLPDRPVSALLTSRNGNLLYMYDGNNAYKRYQSTYLPANAILLR